MLHADSFQLCDSMSALEMMDPKMDAGVANNSVKPAGVFSSRHLSSNATLQLPAPLLTIATTDHCRSHSQAPFALVVLLHSLFLLNATTLQSTESPLTPLPSPRRVLRSRSHPSVS